MRDLLSFQRSSRSSFLPNNQLLFPTVPPEQETLPLPDSAEPEWPRVSFGNPDDALFSFQSPAFVGSLFLPASARPPGRGRGLEVQLLLLAAC